MSAIFGGIAKRQVLPEDLLEQMREGMADWVQSRVGHWRGDGVALGHLLVAGTPEAVYEEQPESSPNTGLLGTFDARLDNRQELSARLGLASERLTDSRLFLSCYERSGPACLDEVQGDFALAVWDPKSRVLFCGRDPVGARPLFYVDSAAWFLFASDPEALLAVPGVSGECDMQAVVNEICSSTEASRDGKTIYSSIRRLLPGHWLRVSAEQAGRAATGGLTIPSR